MTSSAGDVAWRTKPTILPMAHAFTTSTITVAANYCNRRSRADDTRLFSLKPAAIPLMDSGKSYIYTDRVSFISYLRATPSYPKFLAGKALARSGELLIDLTTALDIYGGSLSATGANIRNCGDCLAQAAASCRFKTAAELVTDELREVRVVAL